jgi:hypothetical protein
MICWGHGRALVGKAAENLRSLAQQLDDIASGFRPTPDDLAHAPLLDAWEPKLTATHAPAIRGRVQGHPLIADGETIRCDILAADPDLAWVLTWAGFYRLGDALPSPTHSEARA